MKIVLDGFNTNFTNLENEWAEASQSGKVSWEMVFDRLELATEHLDFGGW